MSGHVFFFFFFFNISLNFPQFCNFYFILKVIIVNDLVY